MAEHRFCKPVVVGSTPTASLGMRRAGGKAERGALVAFLRLCEETGRWPSGQWHQTVNLTWSPLRGFESLPAQLKSGMRKAEVGMSILQAALVAAGVAQLVEL